MGGSPRRWLLRSAAGLIVGMTPGCLAGGGSTEDGESPLQWTASPDCDPMQSSLIQYQGKTSAIPDGIVPVQYTDLTIEEKLLVRTVIDEGGYATCEVSETFQRFVERVQDHLSRQDETQKFSLYVARDGEFYDLYIEKTDMIIAD